MYWEMAQEEISEETWRAGSSQVIDWADEYLPKTPENQEMRKLMGAIADIMLSVAEWKEKR